MRSRRSALEQKITNLGQMLDGLTHWLVYSFGVILLEVITRHILSQTE